LSGLHWQPIAGLDRGKLKETRLQAHFAAQWLARCARAYIAPRPDDGHTSFGWDDAWGGFCTHPLPDGVRLGLRISDLTLVLLNAGRIGPSLSLDGSADTDARAWLGRECAARGLDARKLDEPSPYAMPAYAIASGAKYSPGKLIEALRDLATWYANANGLLGEVGQRLAARKLNAPAVRCWPHHFDLDSLISLGLDRTTGLGFSPGDEYYDEPYFYVTIYPEPEAATLPPLPKVGHWHTRDFIAAVAPAGKIVMAKDQRTETNAFLNAACDAALKILS
jgi:hypothetical protein